MRHMAAKKAATAAGKSSKSAGGAKSGGAKAGGAKSGAKSAGAKSGGAKGGAKSAGAKNGGAKSGGSKSLTNHGRPWSSADMKMLRDLAKKATPTRSAAQTLGRSLDSVKSKASEEGISFKPRTAARGRGR